MMLKRETTPQDGSRPGSRTRGNRTGSSVFAVFAGVAMVCTGATAAALAGSHAAIAASTSSGCQVLPSAPSSPGPSPTQTATAGPNGSSVQASSTPNATPTDLCVTVTAQASSVHSGQGALYSITVRPKSGKADDVTVQIAASASDSSPAPSAPSFTVCGTKANAQTCSLGTMNSGQATELQAEVSVPSGAPTGDRFTLSATVTGAAPGATTTGSVIGAASVSAVAPSPTPTKTHSSPPSNHHHTGSGHHHHHSDGGSGSGGSGSSGSSGTTGNTNPLAGLPPLTSSGGSNPSNPSGLFPTINPSSSASPPRVGSTGSKVQRPYKATTVADVLPLNPDQLSTQVAALVVLCIGIILVFARISLRRPKSPENK
jgi:uncharacterized membrane protein YgcG